MFNQHCKDNTLHFEKSGNFQLRVSSDVDNQDKLISWIREREFCQYEKPRHRVERAVSNRVMVYMLTLPWNNQQVVMKVSSINPLYNRRRKAELLIRNLIKKDYNLQAFEGCRALRKNKILVACPLAFWSTGTGLSRKSYFLYNKIDKTTSCNQLIESLNREHKNESRRHKIGLLKKLIEIVHTIHNTGWRHGDLVPKNFLLDLPCDINLINTDIYLIDYDECHRAKIKLSFIKKFYDLKCLRGLRKIGLPYRDILVTYQNGQHSRFWYWVLLFWIRGGFNISRQLNRHLQRTSDSHLTKSD